MNLNKVVRILGLVLLWLVTLLEALSMFAAGTGKFTNGEFWGQMFESWGYSSSWFLPLIGIGEAGAALFLLVPKTAPYAAAILISIMLGALFTVVTKESGNLGPGIVVVNLIFLGTVLWFRRPGWVIQRTKSARSNDSH